MRNFFSSLRRAELTRKLWFAGGGVGLFLLVLVIGNQFIPRDKSVTRQMLGHDFLAFYTAGSFVRQGRYHEMYLLDPVRDFEHATGKQAGLEVGKSFGPWWNPPFYALAFEPLAALSYPVALMVWRWISVVAVLAAIGLLATIIARVSRPPSVSQDTSETSALRQWRAWGLVPLLILVSMPFLQALSHGQNTFTSLLLLTVTVLLWRSERRFVAGLVGGLLFYKPQLAAVVALAMVFDLGWTALAGFGVTGLALLAVSAIAMPGSIMDFLHLLPANVRWMQVEHAYLWERHVTLKAFWRLLLQGREAGEATWATTVLTYLSVAAVGGGLIWAALCGRKETGGERLWLVVDQPENRQIRRDRFIAATVAVMPLLMPFYFDYDLLLLAVPATLYAAERLRRPDLVQSGDVWLIRTWAALFFWLFVNPAVGLHTHMNVTVILLTAVAGQLVYRAGRCDEGVESLVPAQDTTSLGIAA